MKLTMSLKTRFWDFVIKIDCIFILSFGYVLNIQNLLTLVHHSHTFHVHYFLLARDHLSGGCPY